MRPLRVAVALAALVVLGACADSVIRELEPGNEQAVVSLPDSFTYIASNLENVSDRVEFQWTNSEPRVTVNHLSFLPHGYGLLIIRDAVGAVVDSTLLEYQLVTESRLGIPGPWTITLIYTGAFGRAQFSLVPLAAPPDSRIAGDAVAPAAPIPAGSGSGPVSVPLQKDARGTAARGSEPLDAARAMRVAPP